MYKQIETDETFFTEHGSDHSAVATLEDECGGKSQIGVDDSCYVLYQRVKKSPDLYRSVRHWYREAVGVLQTLPVDPRDASASWASPKLPHTREAE